MAKNKNCWDYWKENIETGKGRFDMICWLITIVFVMAGFVLRSINPTSPILNEMTDDELGKILLWIGTVLAVFWFFWLPFRRHEKEQTKHQNAYDELNSKIKDLQEKISAQNKHEEIASQLGKYHQKICDRISEISQLSSFRFFELNEAAVNEGKMDATSTVLLYNVESYLTEFVKGKYAAIFNDPTDFKLTPIFQDRYEYDDSFKHRKHRHWTIEFLTHRAKQLMKVINEFPSMPPTVQK